MASSVDWTAALHTLAQVGGVAAVALLLLGGCGLLLAGLLPRALRPFLPLFAPVLGYALVSGICHYLAAAGFSLRQGCWMLLPLAVAGWARMAIDRGLRRSPRAALRPALLATAAFLVAALPVVRLGYVTTVGNTIDAISYATRSEYLQEAPFGVPEVPPGRPHLSHVASQIELVRAGDVLVVGLLGLLTDRRSYELLTLVPALFFGLLAGGTYVALRLARCRRSAATMAAALVALNNLLLWPVYDNFLSQSIGLAFLPFAFAAAVEGSRRPSWRSAATFGVLLSGLWSTYPVFACYLLVATLVAWAGVLALRGWRSRPSPGRLLAWWLAAGLAMLAVNAVAVWRSRTEFAFVAHLFGETGVQRVGRGNIVVFPPPLEIFGLISHPAAAYTADWRGPVPLTAWAVIGVLAAAGAAFGWSLLRPGSRIAYGALVATIGAFLLHQRYLVNAPQGYPYGYFKVATILAWPLTALLGAGLVELVRRHRAAVVAGAAALGLCGFQALSMQRFMLDNHLVLTRELIAGGQRAGALDDAAWVVVDVPQGMRQHWLAYLLSGQNMAFRTHPWTGELLATASMPGTPRHALVDLSLDSQRAKDREEPWYRPGDYDRLWSNGTYELRRRRPIVRLPLGFDPGPWSAPLELVGVAGRPEVQVRLEDRDVPLAVVGGPRTLQVQVLAPRPAELAMGGQPPIELPAGLWTVDLAIQPGCLVDGASLVPVAGEPLLLEVVALARATGDPGACAELEASRAGVTYLETQATGDRARFELLLHAPQRRPYRFGAHIWDGSRLFGVFSVDFPPGEGLRRGALELDLSRRQAVGTIDGVEVPISVTDLIVDHGSMEASAVWWAFAPIEQLSVGSVLWFHRSPGGEVSRVRTAPPRLQALAPP